MVHFCELFILFCLVKWLDVESLNIEVGGQTTETSEVGTQPPPRCAFYSASALLAMQSAVLARGIPSVCLSVCLSVTFRYCVQTNEDTIVRFSVSCRTNPLVSGEVKFIRIFAGDHPQRGVKVRHPSIDS